MVYMYDIFPTEGKKAESGNQIQPVKTVPGVSLISTCSDDERKLAFDRGSFGWQRNDSGRKPSLLG